MASRKPKMAREIAREKDMLNQSKQIEQLKKDRDELELKIRVYMEVVSMYKAQNADLIARCEELEELLSEAENKLENENMRCTEQIKITQNLEKQRDEAEHKCDRLLEERYNLRKELEYARKPWWKKVLNRG